MSFISKIPERHDEQPSQQHHQQLRRQQQQVGHQQQQRTERQQRQQRTPEQLLVRLPDLPSNDACIFYNAESAHSAAGATRAAAARTAATTAKNSFAPEPPSYHEYAFRRCSRDFLHCSGLEALCSVSTHFFSGEPAPPKDLSIQRSAPVAAVTGAPDGTSGSFDGSVLQRQGFCVSPHQHRSTHGGIYLQQLQQQRPQEQHLQQQKQQVQEQQVQEQEVQRQHSQQQQLQQQRKQRQLQQVQLQQQRQVQGGQQLHEQQLHEHEVQQGQSLHGLKQQKLHTQSPDLLSHREEGFPTHRSPPEAATIAAAASAEGSSSVATAAVWSYLQDGMGQTRVDFREQQHHLNPCRAFQDPLQALQQQYKLQQHKPQPHPVQERQQQQEQQVQRQQRHCASATCNLPVSVPAGRRADSCCNVCCGNGSSSSCSNALKCVSSGLPSTSPVSPVRLAVEQETSTGCTHCRNSTDFRQLDSVIGRFQCCCHGSSRAPRKSIQLLTGSTTVHDYYRLGELLSVCSLLKPLQQGQHRLKPGQRNACQGVSPGDGNRPLLYHAVTGDERREKRVLKVIKKKRGALQSEAENSWRRMCTHLLNLPPHPNVLSFEAVLETSEAYVFASEQLEGGELFDFLLREKTVHEDVCQFIMVQILRALDHLHRHNLLHRDVKPENLMFRRRVRSHVASAAATRLQQRNHQQESQQQLEVDEEEKKHLEEVERATAGVAQRVNRSAEPPLLSMEEQHELLLIDFDTSMFIDDPSGNSNEAVTPHRRLVGTYGYLAPEVLKSGCYTPASDLWSVGVILYILMTGSPPLPMEFMTSARSALAVVKQVSEQQGGIDFEAASLVEFPSAQDLCRRLLEMDPRKRIQTAAEALEHPWLDSARNRSLPGCRGLSPPEDSHGLADTHKESNWAPSQRCQHQTAIDVALVDPEVTSEPPNHASIGSGDSLSFIPFEVANDTLSTDGCNRNVDLPGENHAQFDGEGPMVLPAFTQEGTASTQEAVAYCARAAVRGAGESLGVIPLYPRLPLIDSAATYDRKTFGRISSNSSTSSTGNSGSSIKSSSSVSLGSAPVALLPAVAAEQQSSASKSWSECSIDSGQTWCGKSPFQPLHATDAYLLNPRKSSDWSCATTVGRTAGEYSSSSSSSSLGGSFSSSSSLCCTPESQSPITRGPPYLTEVCSSKTMLPSCPAIAFRGTSAKAEVPSFASGLLFEDGFSSSIGTSSSGTHNNCRNSHSGAQIHSQSNNYYVGGPEEVDAAQDDEWCGLVRPLHRRDNTPLQSPLPVAPGSMLCGHEAFGPTQLEQQQQQQTVMLQMQQMWHVQGQQHLRNRRRAANGLVWQDDQIAQEDGIVMNQSSFAEDCTQYSGVPAAGAAVAAVGDQLRLSPVASNPEFFPAEAASRFGSFSRSKWNHVLDDPAVTTSRPTAEAPMDKTPCNWHGTCGSVGSYLSLEEFSSDCWQYKQQQLLQEQWHYQQELHSMPSVQAISSSSRPQPLASCNRLTIEDVEASQNRPSSIRFHAAETAARQGFTTSTHSQCSSRRM
ncbi:protein kinase, putative [Eimeria tenella]|uniref:Protein kinase, putative n=1 Tax=Eimeria tenella TaxID=5802 RepID=U6KUY5_EIMTE|nr:protein kinase, putative [Eimeria tenella]CDJ41912.1 protein kinase, putative [Eimeria tenella]|eukprot:XP_013232662.1 protein kinase, putative [Eimeria tenella]